MELASLITLSNNLLRILPDAPDFFAFSNDFVISSKTSCFPTTTESNPQANLKR